jgi:hypothetical protein
MPDTPLADRYPEVVHLLHGYVGGDGTLADVMERYVAAETVDRTLDVLAELEELLSDPSVPEEELDAFARAHSPRWLGSGRETLGQVSEALLVLMEAMAGIGTPDPPPERPPPDVEARLAAWLREGDMWPPEDFVGWSIVDSGEGRWLLTPPELAGVILAITPDTIRAINPAHESVPDSLRELGFEG